MLKSKLSKLQIWCGCILLALTLLLRQSTALAQAANISEGDTQAQLDPVYFWDHPETLNIWIDDRDNSGAILQHDWPLIKPYITDSYSKAGMYVYWRSDPLVTPVTLTAGPPHVWRGVATANELSKAQKAMQLAGPPAGSNAPTDTKTSYDYKTVIITEIPSLAVEDSGIAVAQYATYTRFAGAATETNRSFYCSKSTPGLVIIDPEALDGVAAEGNKAYTDYTDSVEQNWLLANALTHELFHCTAELGGTQFNPFNFRGHLAGGHCNGLDGKEDPTCVQNYRTSKFFPGHSLPNGRRVKGDLTQYHSIHYIDEKGVVGRGFYSPWHELAEINCIRQGMKYYPWSLKPGYDAFNFSPHRSYG